MTSKTFVSGTTIDSAWLNDVNDSTYTADTAPVGSFRASLESSSGSSLVGYLPSGTGAAATDVQSKLRESISVKDFGAVGDGVTEDTSAIQAAFNTTAIIGETCYAPSGTYVCGALTIPVGLKLVGESSNTSILKAKNGLNANFITGISDATDRVYIRGIKLDGNSANNTTGNTLTLSGGRMSLIDMVVLYSAGTAVTTSMVPALSAGNIGSFEGFFSHIFIDKSQGSGWIHNGPGDSKFSDVHVLDAGLKQTLTYYGIQFNASARCSNVHVWDRDEKANITLAGVHVNQQGLTFTNCHFESGQYALRVDTSNNTFESCSYYAPGGSHAVYLAGYQNILSGVLGPGYRSFNQNYGGIYLSGSYNIIDVAGAGAVSPVTLGLTQGAVQFVAGEGRNVVTVRGYCDTGVAYVGTPSTTDTVNLLIDGAVGTSYYWHPSTHTSWSTYTPTVTAISGTITSASATGRYKLIGKTCHISIQVNIVNNGTGSVAVNASLPFAASVLPFVLSGRESATSGIALCGIIGAENSVVNIFSYSNSYPGGSGSVLNISGTYEIA